MTKTLRTMVGSMLLAMAPLAVAQTSGSIDTETQKLNTAAENHGQAQVAARIAADFTTLAGSKDNSLALVRALRNGTQVTLTTTSAPATGAGGTTGTSGTTATTTTTSFTPPTGKMGWGNVFISLALAQNSLAQLGITKPTTAQLQAALVGGTVTGADGSTTTLKGVLTLRAGGMGWGQIAHSLGTNVGPVVSAIRSTHGKVAQLPVASSSSTGTTSAANTPKSTATTATASTHGSHGLTTAGGATSAPRGQGIVTAAGGSGGTVTGATASHGHGNATAAGLVSASGGNVSGAVSNAGGSGADNGKGHGKGRPGG